MPRPFTDFTSQFFWDFKRMDNTNYNFEILNMLYRCKRINNNDQKFNKPLTILLMAIIECSLYDFLIRINQFKHDSFPNIRTNVVAFFRKAKETDELKTIVSRIKSQNLLRVGPNDSLYEDLDHLRKVRNRVHIQNRHNELARDENRVFTNQELNKAQDCFLKVFDALCNVYPRWGNPPIDMQDFPRPWL